MDRSRAILLLTNTSFYFSKSNMLEISYEHFEQGLELTKYILCSLHCTHFG